MREKQEQKGDLRLRRRDEQKENPGLRSRNEIKGCGAEMRSRVEEQKKKQG